MKLEPYKDEYPLEDFGELVSLCVDTGVRTRTGTLYPIRMIGESDMAQLRLREKPTDKKLCGLPACAAIIGPGTILCLYPAPDKAYDLVGRYYPAMREF